MSLVFPLIWIFLDFLWWRGGSRQLKAVLPSSGATGVSVVSVSDIMVSMGSNGNLCVLIDFDMCRFHGVLFRQQHFVANFFLFLRQQQPFPPVSGIFGRHHRCRWCRWFAASTHFEHCEETIFIFVFVVFIFKRIISYGAITATSVEDFFFFFFFFFVLFV